MSGPRASTVVEGKPIARPGLEFVFYPAADHAGTFTMHVKPPIDIVLRSEEAMF